MDLTYAAAIPQQEFVERRAKLATQMQDNSALVLFSATEKIRNNDCCYPFRQDSYFWYLTGFNEPDSALLLLKTHNELQTIIFLRPSDPLMETWNGRRLGVAAAPNKLLLDQAYSIDDFKTEFAKTTKNLTALYYAPEHQPWGQSLLTENLNDLKQVFDWRPLLDEMRLFKSAAEIALMQQAGQISALAHIRAMKQMRPNRLEYEIESEILHEFNRFGARFSAYNTIVAGGENACILHYTENNQSLQDGDLVLIDAG